MKKMLIAVASTMLFAPSANAQCAGCDADFNKAERERMAAEAKAEAAQAKADAAQAKAERDRAEKERLREALGNGGAGAAADAMTENNRQKDKAADEAGEPN